MKFQAGLLQERAFGPSPGRGRDSAESLKSGACVINNRSDQRSVYKDKILRGDAAFL